MVSDELYTALAALQPSADPGNPGGPIAAVFDTKMPDSYQMTPAPVIVFQLVSDVPDISLEGAVSRESRWQVSIYALDLADARAAKELVIGALGGYRGTAIKRCNLADAGAESYESDVDPPVYYLSIDFWVLQ